MYEIRHYVTLEGKDPYLGWLKLLRDPIAKLQIVERVNRIEQGNFGDHRFCRDGVWELRVDAGPGYRVYYARVGAQIICCCAAVTSARKMPTLLVRLGIGKTGNRGPNERPNERPITR